MVLVKFAGFFKLNFGLGDPYNVENEVLKFLCYYRNAV
jgi:hypothetical protein